MTGVIPPITANITVVSPPAPIIGLVIPCFRESGRLPRFLPALLDCIADLRDCRVIVQIVDDGSGVVEAELLGQLIAAENLRHPGILRHPLVWERNRGKGAAVRAGWDALADACDWLMFVDADGAVPPDETCRVMIEATRTGQDTAIFGERTEEMTVERNPMRKCLGLAFRALVRVALRLPVRDSQCGIKSIPVTVFKVVRPELRRDDFAFDIELALALLGHGFQIKPVAVRWKEQAGSHIKGRHLVAMALAVAGYGLRGIIRGRKRYSPNPRG